MIRAVDNHGLPVTTAHRTATENYALNLVNWIDTIGRWPNQSSLSITVPRRDRNAQFSSRISHQKLRADEPGQFTFPFPVTLPGAPIIITSKRQLFVRFEVSIVRFGKNRLHTLAQISVSPE
jgi:hypothetical protein